MRTLVIDNFKGSMTVYADGDINSGYANILESFGYDSFAKPGNLTWSENPVQIDSGGSVITDMILDGKERVENGISYLYAIGHTGRLYKIQVNDPTTYNPNYDNPVLLATLTSGTPTFTRGAFMEFYGATEKIYIGHDKGVTSIAFDGSGETVVGVLGSWTQNVPRQIKQFLGKLYIGNGANIAEIDTTLSVTSYTKLSPGFPDGTQVRDLDVSPSGTYMDIVVTRLALGDITSTAQDTSIITISDSWIFKWNGTDTGYTSFDSFPNVILTSNIMFGFNQYTFGYDGRGVAIFNPVNRIISSGFSSSFAEAPGPKAISSDGGLVSWIAPLYFEDHLEISFCVFGVFDWETQPMPGFWSPMGLLAKSPETDIVRIPFMKTVSNYNQGISSNGYTSNIFGTSKLYFSTLETSSAPTTAYRFYRWSPLTTGLGTAFDLGVYQTQSQMMSKKAQIKEVRIYGDPWVANNSFQIDLIGSGGNVISGSTKVFTAGTDMTIGDDFAWYTPNTAPTYMLGLRLTNLGTANHTINKVEIDITEGGK